VRFAFPMTGRDEVKAGENTKGTGKKVAGHTDCSCFSELANKESVLLDRHSDCRWPPRGISIGCIYFLFRDSRSAYDPAVVGIPNSTSVAILSLFNDTKGAINVNKPAHSTGRFAWKGGKMPSCS
jgi:hypothetical protein